MDGAQGLVGLAGLRRASFTGWVPFEFNANPGCRTRANDGLMVCGRQVPLVVVRNPRARRYVLRLRPDGSARVTIPRGGSAAEAGRFLAHNMGWLERQLQRRAARPLRPKEWSVGTEILFRGEPIRIEAGINRESGMIRVGSEQISVPDHAVDLRRTIEGHLWSLAAKELPPRVFEFAALHQLPLGRVTVRNQRSRWGSCSRCGTISLNWRLIQTPRHVQDYIILHELCHLREMNHSHRFWREVERVCPEFEAAEQWLKRHALLLG
jgi:predicted metal-dependent hydrolase